MDDYVEAGGNSIDTADVYSAGVSEEINRPLAQRQARNRQGSGDRHQGSFPHGRRTERSRPVAQHLGAALDASLKRLGVEQVDLYQMHAWDALTPLEETLRFLDDSIRNGKIAYYGFSNFLGWHLTKAVWLAKASGYTPPVTLQPVQSAGPRHRT
jgi:aryl-alcohol dehydrogenase-like predicted oxidoreductase